MQNLMNNWLKPIIVGIAIGAVIAIVLAFARGNPTFDILTQLLAQRVFGDIMQFLSQLREAGAPDHIISIAVFVVGPGLPYVAGASFAFIVIPLLKIRSNGCQMVEYIWPRSPDILDNQLERPRVDPIDPYYPDRPFLGRGIEMQTLLRFAGPDLGEKPAVLALIGVEGMGKTRLALAWLSRLKELGWDVGVLKKDVSPLDIERARFRRKTAIVIDEPSSDRQDFYAVIDALSAKSKQLRIVVADRMIMPRAPGSHEEQMIPEIHLEPIADNLLRALAPTLSARALTAAEGRPLYALLGDDPARTIAARAHRRLLEAKILGGEDAQRLLALAALAGPVGNKSLRVSKTDLSLMRRLFEGAPRKLVAQVLPSLKPARFANAVLLQYAEERTENALHDLVAEALAANPAAVETRLGSLWSGADLTEAQSAVLAFMQTQFDVAEPNRVANIHDAAIQCFEDTASVTAENVDRVDLAAFDVALERIRNISEQRPFDEIVRGYEIMAAVNASAIYGKIGRWDNLERWGQRVGNLTASEPFRSYIEYRQYEAEMAVNAANYYGKVQRWTDLERWGQRVDALTASEPLRSDPAIRLREVVAAGNAINSYGWARCWTDLERWGRRITELAATETFCFDPDIRLQQAKVVVNATYFYGNAERWDDLERWGRCVTELTATEPFRSDPSIRLQESRVAVNAIATYGKDGRWGDLERWGHRIIQLVIAEPFRSDSAIRLHEAKAAFNAVDAYGRAELWTDLERWGQRVTDLVSTEPFHSDPAIRLCEAEAATSAVYSYGRARRWDDLERWAQRVIGIIVTKPLHSDPAIRLQEALTALDAMIAYGKGGRWDDLERWGLRITELAATEPFRFDPAIRLQEAKAAASAAYSYGIARRWDDLERWSQCITELAATEPFCSDPAIRLEEVTAAAAAFDLYGRAGMHGTSMTKRWRSRVSDIARGLPYDPRIQEVAHSFGLNAAAQFAQTALNHSHKLEITK